MTFWIVSWKCFIQIHNGLINHLKELLGKITTLRPILLQRRTVQHIRKYKKQMTSWQRKIKKWWNGRLKVFGSFKMRTWAYSVVKLLIDSILSTLSLLQVQVVIRTKEAYHKMVQQQWVNKWEDGETGHDAERKEI